MSNHYKRDLVRIEVPILSTILDCKSIFLSEQGRQGITMPYFAVLLCGIRNLFIFINEKEIRPSNRSKIAFDELNEAIKVKIYGCNNMTEKTPRKKYQEYIKNKDL